MKRLFCIISIAAAALSSCIHSVKTSAPSAEGKEAFLFQAEPPVIAPGEESILRWNVPGVTRVTIEEAVGFERLRQLGAFSNAGTLKVRPVEDSTYVISCGESSGILCQSVSVRVRVRQP